MDKKHAENEMKYRLLKILLAAMQTDGIISESEFVAILKKIVKKLKPLVGGLE